MPAPIFCQENRLVALGATFIGLTLLRLHEPSGGPVTGQVRFDGQDLLGLEPHERAAAGLFLGFAQPAPVSALTAAWAGGSADSSAYDLTSGIDALFAEE